jgi:hypothetical protein
MSDRLAWLAQWCPECRARPGARCTRRKWNRQHRSRSVPVARLHVARGWLERCCPTCKAEPGERCSTPGGREASHVHVARLRPARDELLWRPAVWEELERRGATAAIVPFSGRVGSGGRTGTITLLDTRGGELLDVERWTARDKRCYALEAPVWDRFGTFAGHPLTRGEVIWSALDRCVLIRGERGETTFEEIVA